MCLALEAQLWFIRLNMGKRARPPSLPYMMVLVFSRPGEGQVQVQVQVKVKLQVWEGT